MSVEVFENSLGRGLVFQVPNGRREVVYLRFKKKDLVLKLLKRDGKLPDRLV